MICDWKPSYLLISLSFLLLIGCNETTSTHADRAKSEKEAEQQSVNAANHDENTELSPAVKQDKLAESNNQPINSADNGEWQAILERGFIRAVKLTWETEAALPRSGTSSLSHFDLLEQFAETHELEIQWRLVDSLPQMFELLKDGKIDLIPRHLTITESRQNEVLFTAPILIEQEVLVGHKKNAELVNQSIENLKTSALTVHLPHGTSYMETVKADFPNWQIEALEDGVDPDGVVDKIENGEIKLTIFDKSTVNQLLAYRKNIQSIAILPGIKYLSWAVNKENKTLKNVLGDFIRKHQIDLAKDNQRVLDLAQLKKQNLPLRMITRNSPETYFLWRGELMGFEYELMKAFAKKHGLRLEVQVADTYAEMIDLLNDGKGDVIAAGLSRTASRVKDLTFSIRYNRVSEMIVAHKDAPLISRTKDLRDRTITVRESSAFWETAKLLERYNVNVEAADEQTSTEMLIGQVADKAIDLTIADSNLIAIEKSFRNEIVTPLKLKDSIPYAYVTRPDNSQLLNALNQFIRETYRKTFYNVVKNKYFSDASRKTTYRDQRIVGGDALSPFDDIVKTHADSFGFDWRLIVAQMYQESRFNPQAKSFAGALGLMQVLPRTGKELGFENLKQPEEGIAAGVSYLDWTKARFSEELPIQERLNFALASYNAGYGHVKDAQRLAKQLGLDQNKWFNNVERAMLLLQQPKYYKNTRFGYCRGSEPVNYVRSINQRYLSYLEIMN